MSSAVRSQSARYLDSLDCRAPRGAAPGTPDELLLPVSGGCYRMRSMAHCGRYSKNATASSRHFERQSAASAEASSA